VNDPVAPVASESPSEAPLAGPPPAASTPATPSPQRGAAPTARARIIRSGRLSIHASLPTAAAGSVRVEVRGRLHGRAVVYVTAVRVRAGRVTATVVLPRRLRGVRVSGVRLRYRDGAGRARTVRARG
jgi:hypothetical protein